MKNKIIVGASIAAAFVVGFECGGNHVQTQVRRRMGEAIPLLTNALTTVTKRVHNENLSADEANTLFEQELDFIKIVVD